MECFECGRPASVEQLTPFVELDGTTGEEWLPLCHDDIADREEWPVRKIES